MAIKNRLLLKLKSTCITMNMAAPFHPQRMNFLYRNLLEARELCQQGLSEGNFAKYGEIYDGLIMGIEQVLSGESDCDAGEIMNLCKELLQHIVLETKKEEHFKKEMVFLPYKYSMWDSLESVWQAAYEDKDNCLVYVIPVPYCERNPDGTAKAWHCEREYFPSEIPTLDWQDVDLERLHPDVIFIHYPYDGCNIVTSLDSNYYSHNLRQWTDCLVYIPYYATAGNMSEVQKLCPAYANVDYIVIQAEKYKKFFDESVPEEKFLPLGSPKFDKVIRLCQNPPEPPAEWKEKLQGRRVYFYNTSLQGVLDFGSVWLQKMEYVFSIFRNRKDVCLLWRPHPLLEATLKSMREEYVPEFERLREQYIAEDFGIYDTTPDIEKTIALCDAYIGDGITSVTSLFGMAGKPVFYLNNLIHQLPEKDDWLGQVNRVWNFLPKQWLMAYGNQLWHDRDGDMHYHHACDLSQYGGGSYYGTCMELDNRLYVCPNNAQDILVVEDEQVTKKIPLKREVERPGAFFWGGYDYPDNEDYFFLIPVLYPAIVRYDFRHDKVDYVPCPNKLFVENVDNEKWRGGFFCWRDWLILGSAVNNGAFAVNRHTLETRTMVLCDEKFTGSMFVLVREWGDDDYFFFPYRGTKATRWNVRTGETTYYDFPEGFYCKHPTRGDISYIRPFSSGIFQDENTILLAPLWGNMFVKLHIDTGVMEEWKTPFKVTTDGQNVYYFAGTTGFFITELDRDTPNWRPKRYQFYYKPERRRYDFDPKTETFTPVEEDAVLDEAEMRQHIPGFCQMSEYDAYGCWEDAFNSLEDFISDNLSGHPFDKEKQLAAYSEIAANNDGTAGEKIYEYIRAHGKGGAR